MELDQIKAFVFAVEEGSVQGAARRLNRSQPAVSRLIQALESHFGGDLLDRSTRPATATAFGRQVFDQARLALEAVARMEGHSRRPAGRELQPFRLGVSHAYSRLVASPWVRQVLQAPGQPAVSLQAGWSLPLLRQLQESTLDAALTGFPPGWLPPSNLRGEQIREEPLVVIAPPELAPTTTVRLRDLAQLPWVLNSDGCGLRGRLESEFTNAGYRLLLRLELQGSLSQHIEFVAAGFGLGLVPKRALALHPQRKHVRRVSTAETLATRLWLLWRPLDPIREACWARIRLALARSATARAL